MDKILKVRFQIIKNSLLMTIDEQSGFEKDFNYTGKNGFRLNNDDFLELNSYSIFFQGDCINKKNLIAIINFDSQSELKDYCIHLFQCLKEYFDSYKDKTDDWFYMSLILQKEKWVDFNFYKKEIMKKLEAALQLQETLYKAKQEEIENKPQDFNPDDYEIVDGVCINCSLFKICKISGYEYKSVECKCSLSQIYKLKTKELEKPGKISKEEWLKEWSKNILPGTTLEGLVYQSFENINKILGWIYEHEIKGKE